MPADLEQILEKLEEDWSPQTLVSCLTEIRASGPLMAQAQEMAQHRSALDTATQPLPMSLHLLDRFYNGALNQALLFRILFIVIAEDYWWERLLQIDKAHRFADEYDDSGSEPPLVMEETALYEHIPVFSLTSESGHLLLSELQPGMEYSIQSERCEYLGDGESAFVIKDAGTATIGNITVSLEYDDGAEAAIVTILPVRTDLLDDNAQPALIKFKEETISPRSTNLDLDKLVLEFVGLDLEKKYELIIDSGILLS